MGSALINTAERRAYGGREKKDRAKKVLRSQAPGRKSEKAMANLFAIALAYSYLCKYEDNGQTGYCVVNNLHRKCRLSSRLLPDTFFRESDFVCFHHKNGFQFFLTRIRAGLFILPCPHATNITTMNNDNNTIYGIDVHLICNFFLHTERQGPGSPDATLKALGFIDNLSDAARIADLGCGTGGQTMVLAQNVSGDVTGLDVFPGFIDKFNRNAAKLHLQNRVRGIVGSMDNLPFGRESLDLIWSEGAIYNIGFERGISEWRDYLKPGGYIAVSESSWFTEERPAEMDDFWMREYPEIDTIPVKVAQMQQAGYLPVASFVLSEECWTEHYYRPWTEARRQMRIACPGSEALEKLFEFQRLEESLYHKYKKFYGYVFYIGKKI